MINLHLLKTLLSILSSPAPIRADLISFLVGAAPLSTFLVAIMVEMFGQQRESAIDEG